MTVEAQVIINGSVDAVWAVLADIENSAKIISGIEKIEIVDRPVRGILGWKWNETRMLFGKPATVEKVIIAVAENEFFTTESKDGGFVFSTYNRIWEGNGGTILRSQHETRPQGFAAKLKSLPMVFFKGVIKKAILKDLDDIKKAVEQGSAFWSAGPPKTNWESWQDMRRFIEMFADDDHWSKWKPMARSVIGALEVRGLAPTFRIGQSMHDIILSTSDHHRLTIDELRVRMAFDANTQTVHVAYGPGRPEVEEQVPISVVLPRILHYLQRLWNETKPGVQMPDGLRTT